MFLPDVLLKTVAFPSFDAVPKYTLVLCACSYKWEVLLGRSEL
jgi:hypothetical protein